MASRKILVAEDDAIVRMIVEQALLDAGFTVETHDGAADAIAALENQSAPDAIVSDIRLGGSLSGWDVARRARELHPGIGVVYVSGDSGVEWHAQGVPGSIFIQKPFAEAQVITAVSTVINNASSANAA